MNELKILFNSLNVKHMRQKLFALFLFAFLLNTSSFAEGSSISIDNALQVVKSRYDAPASCLFYYAPTDSIFDDGDQSCIFGTIPQQAWLTKSYLSLSCRYLFCEFVHQRQHCRYCKSDKKIVERGETIPQKREI